MYQSPQTYNFQRPKDNKVIKKSTHDAPVPANYTLESPVIKRPNSQYKNKGSSTYDQAELLNLANRSYQTMLQDRHEQHKPYTQYQGSIPIQLYKFALGSSYNNKRPVINKMLTPQRDLIHYSQIDKTRQAYPTYYNDALKQSQQNISRIQESISQQGKIMTQKSPYYSNQSPVIKPSIKQASSETYFKSNEKEDRLFNQKREPERVQTESDAFDDSPHKLAAKRKQQAQYKSISQQGTELQQRPSNQLLLTQMSFNHPLDHSKYSQSKSGILRNYAANTHQGLVRNYNEDRVSIIVNVNHQNGVRNQSWPNCSFFAVYDGHGGCSCSDFLRDNLHQYVNKNPHFMIKQIIREPSFPENPREAMQKGFLAAENYFIAQCLENLKKNPGIQVDRAGSCAVCVLIVGDMCYVANLGDSRAVLSVDGGKQALPLTKDHKPNEDSEVQRVTQGGGKIYQQGNSTNDRTGKILGPHRVLPGRLSVIDLYYNLSEAKLEQFGGKKNVVIASPEIMSFKIQETHDFIFLASDGIFDKLNNEEVVQCVWETQNMPFFKVCYIFSKSYGRQQGREKGDHTRVQLACN